MMKPEPHKFEGDAFTLGDLGPCIWCGRAKNNPIHKSSMQASNEPVCSFCGEEDCKEE